MAPIDILAEGGEIYISCASTDEIRSYDSSGRQHGSVALGSTPGGIEIVLDGQHLLVPVGVGQGEMVVIRTSDLKVVRRIPCGHSPVSPKFSPDGNMLAVAQRFRNEVWIYDAVSLERTGVHSVGREPISLQWRNDDQLIVAHHLSSESAVAEWTGCTVGLLNLAEGDFFEIRLEDGTSGIRDLALTPDGKYALCASVIGSHRVPATQIEQGWINKNGLCIVDLEEQAYLGALILDDITLGAANPWGVVVDEEAAWISLSGSHELMRVDYPSLIAELKELDEIQREEFVYNLRRGSAWKERIELDGYGPRAIALDWEGRVLVASYFSSGVERYDPETHETQSVLAGGEVPIGRRGEFLFHDATICFQEWMSCASCHPDARTDALNWDLENDGLGTQRQAKTMLFAHETPPTTVTGIRPNAETSVRAGVRFLRGSLPDEDAREIDTYLKNLTPVSSPYLEDGKLSEDAIVGRKLFHGKAACVRCHDGDYYTNMKLRGVGTGLGDESTMKYDVPSLNEIWRTAPYLHDGRATSIREMLTIHNTSGMHGDVSSLTPNELEQLLLYVKTL